MENYYGNRKLPTEIYQINQRFRTFVLQGTNYEIRFNNSILERRTRGDLIEMFKIKNTFVSNGQSMFTTVFNITVFQDLLNVDQLRIGIGCQ